MQSPGPPARRDAVGVALVTATVVWGLAAFGGAYGWTLVPTICLVGALAIVVRPTVGRRADRLLDIALAAALLACGVQLVPLGPAWRHALSPHADVINASLRLDAVDLASAWHPLSIDPASTMAWLPAGMAAVVLFWASRTLFAHAGLRPVARGIAWTGLVFAPLAIEQAWSTPKLIYWTFRPLDPGGAVFGPFVNRNHMATWLLLAIPTTIGYVVARAAARRGNRHGASGVVAMFGDAKMLWLIASAAVMIAALIAARSRSGMIGLAFAAAAAMLLPRIAKRKVHRRWMAAILGSALTAGLALANTGALLSRFEDARTDALGGRVEIWRQTMPIVRDFALTGTGVGTYGTAMLVYQHGRRAFVFNQAHSQYVQIAAEGGLLLVIPCAFVLVTFVAAAVRSLRSDHSPVFWLRVGALAAITGVAAQSIWETGLRMPANAVLCAVVAAVALHQRRSVNDVRWAAVAPRSSRTTTPLDDPG